MRKTNFDHQFSAPAALFSMFSEKVRGRVRFVFKIAPNLQVNEANYVLLRQYDMLMDIPINFMFFTVQICLAELLHVTPEATVSS